MHHAATADSEAPIVTLPRPVQGPVVLRTLRGVSDVAHVGSHEHAHGVCSVVFLCPLLLFLCLARASSSELD